MPVTWEKSGPNLVAVFRCEVCGRYASHGFDVRLREAIARKDSKLAGRWYCAKHVPAESGSDLFGRAA